MDTSEITAALDSVFDSGLIHHGFTDYLRDYEAYFYLPSYDAAIIPHEIKRFLFRYSVAVEVETTLGDGWLTSLDETYIGDPAEVEEVNGWVWGTREGDMYPGGRVIENSVLAEKWSEITGLSLVEVELNASPHLVRIVFGELEVSQASPGTAPFVVPTPTGWRG